MSWRSLIPLVTAAVGLAACSDQTPLTSSAPLPARGFLPGAQPTRYLVGFEGPAVIPASVLASAGGRVVDSIPLFDVLVLEGVTDPGALAAANPKYIEAEFESSVEALQGVPLRDEAAAVPGQQNTPWYASGVQWDMRAMKADVGWAISNGGDGVKLCVVDTGIDADHQELAGKVLARANFVTSPASETVPSLVYDPNGHGSHVAGEAAGRGVVASGVAPLAGVLGARVLNSSGSGSETAIVNGINWCVGQGAHVVNVSIGGIRYRGTPSYSSSPITYGAAVANATSNGAVVVVSAGNSNLQLPNPGLLVVPAQVPGTIIVGATGPLSRWPALSPPKWDPFDPDQVWRSPDHKAYYSNFGTGVHVFAPGGVGNIPYSEPYRVVDGLGQGTAYDQIWSVCSGQTAQTGYLSNGVGPAAPGSCAGATDRYIAYAGTSMAAPHVAGMAAVLYGELGGARSAANRARVEACIKTTTDHVGPATTYGLGRVDVEKAVEALRAGAC